MTTLTLLKPTPAEQYDESDFVVFPDVPVFKEHDTREVRDEESGEVILAKVHIGPDELQNICDRCNERIEETGDFATLVLRHTDDSGERDPKVVGFCGPYRMGKIGTRKPVAAILGTMRIYKEDAAEAKRYPRVSVEYWADRDDPRCGHFDPVSLLGAEAPELDLGIRYSKPMGDSSGESSARVVRYSKELRFSANGKKNLARYEAIAAAPGGSNTFVPGGIVSKDSTKKRFSKEANSMALAPEDVQQIVAGLRSVVQECVAQAIVAAMNPPDDGLAAGGEMPGADAGAGVMPPAEADAAGSPPLADPGAAGSAGDAAPVPGDANGDGDPDDDNDGIPDTVDDDDDSDPAKAKYSKADGSGDTDPDDTADEGDMGSDGGGKGKMKKETPMAAVAKYRKEANDLRVKYQKEVTARRKVEAERDGYKARIDAAEAESQKAVRYQKLSELGSQGYQLDPDQEAADCSDMSEDQFNKHLDRIATRYSRVPSGMLFTGRPEKYTGDKEKIAKSVKYSKQAEENCLAARKNGKVLDYTKELARLIEADGAAAATAK